WRRWRRRARRFRGVAWWRCSNRTCSPAPRCTAKRSAGRWRAPTSWWWRRSTGRASSRSRVSPRIWWRRGRRAPERRRWPCGTARRWWTRWRSGCGRGTWCSPSGRGTSPVWDPSCCGSWGARSSREPAADARAPQRALGHGHGGRRRRLVRRPRAAGAPRGVPCAADRAGRREEPGARRGDRRAAAAVRCARVGARGRASGTGASSRAVRPRRRTGGDPGRRAGRAGSRREGAPLRGARRPLRAPGDRAADGVPRIPRYGWGVSRDRQLVAGLDLGSTKTCAVIAEVVGDLPRMPLAKVLGVGLAKNAGVRRGMVRDIDETSRSVVAALRDAERMAGAKVGGVTCGIAGEHVSARTSPGVVAVSREEITPEDVARVNEVARAISLGRDQELLHDIPQEYRVDQQHGISDPVGMTGTRLEVEMYLVTVQATAAQNLRKAVQRAGYRVLDLVL